MTAAVAKKAVRWHKLPYTKFILHESKREYFQPFLIGGVQFPFVFYITYRNLSATLDSAAWVICGILPTRGATQEDKEKSNYWKRINGKFDYSHH
ncbi:hypothetical protein DD238_001951 [Peronospora effusa]|uniref:Uncharacterized protein n=1 Tax=Peronospora effusa TaxID=542832 RepID=A0A3M6VK73_9STRA|nr:hypothetical protein DD238_001951 [Peronospora effusa]RQM17440.1 hypothetical protein DD237_001422 [Peronospora effusa]